MIFDTFCRVRRDRVRIENKCPIAALREHQLPRSLIQRPQLQGAGVLVLLRSQYHAVLRRVQPRRNPLAARLQPDLGVAAATPARHRKRSFGGRRMGGGVAAKRSRLHDYAFLAARGKAAQHGFQPLVAFVPPVPEQLGIVWTYDDRGFCAPLCEAAHLLHPASDEMLSVELSFLSGTRRVVGHFGVTIAGDAVVLEARTHACAVRQHIGLQVSPLGPAFVAEIKADIAIIFAIIRVAGVPSLGAPDLGAGLGIPGERTGAACCAQRQARDVLVIGAIAIR
ncbi:hypothetical protein D3C85_891940 [compost metagenome]